MSSTYDTNYSDWPYSWSCKFCHVFSDRTGHHLFKRKGNEIAHKECWDSEDKRAANDLEIRYKEGIARLPESLAALQKSNAASPKDLNRAAALSAMCAAKWQRRDGDGLPPLPAELEHALYIADQYTELCKKRDRDG